MIPVVGLPGSSAEEEWYYKRSGLITRQTKMLNAGWVDPMLTEYMAPNAVAIAAKELGFTGDEVRIALSEAGLLDGKRIGSFEVCAEVASNVSNIDVSELLELSKSEFVEEKIYQHTKIFNSFGINQRPAFHLVSEIEDRAIFSGLVHKEPLEATINAMIDDVVAYRSWAVHMGESFSGA